MDPAARRLSDVLGTTVRTIAPLGGGCVGDVRRAVLEDGRDVVAKLGSPGTTALAIEGRMLAYLAEHTKLPVPRVLFASDTVLVMDYVPSGDAVTHAAEEDAAVHMAALHHITAAAFGFGFDTVIGGLHQPNTQSASWRDFFCDQRLMYMGGQARDAGRLPLPVFSRLEKLCGHLDRWIGAHGAPSLIHGDLWGGNVLVHKNRLAALIDPAIYFADAEMELAFTTLFGTFGDCFFARYGEIRPIAPGFFEERRDLYNLYPLLVHVRLFGGSYVSGVDRTLRKFGF